MSKSEMRWLKCLVAAGVVSAASAGQAQAANLVVNGDFETPSLGSSTFQCFWNSTKSGWLSTFGATGHGSCFINGGKGGWPPAFSGSQFMYVNDYADAGTSAGQTLSLEAGTTYSLTFALASFGAANANVTLGDFTASIVQTQTSWQTYSYLYTPKASGNAALKFTSAATGVVMVDGVSVAALPAPVPVPEPASALLLLCGLGALGAFHRRRSR